MDNEILFLKYLDNQLSEKEAEEIEKLISENEGQKEIFEAVREKREATLKAMDFLNPKGEIFVPPFEAPKRKSGRMTFWRYAAAIILLIALPLGFWWFNQEKTNELLSQQNEIPPTEEKIIGNEELDCYISPNRCWNRRQLVWTVIELND